MGFPEYHPFSQFNDCIYLESGSSGSMPIYIFRFGERGALVELNINDRLNGPHARVFNVTFNGDYYFDLTGKSKDIWDNNPDYVMNSVVEMLEEMKNG